jgi:hypothetical protein
MTTKRRKRKSKRAQGTEPKEQVPKKDVIVLPEAQQPASPIEIELEIEDSASPLEFRDQTCTPISPAVLSADAPSHAEEPASDSPAPTGADRRVYPRYAFTAAAEVIAAEPGAEIRTRVRDLSQQGCFVDTGSPLALGTATDVRITKGTTSFEARARVVFNQPAKGMGLMFTAVESEHVQTLNMWIAESR